MKRLTLSLALVLALTAACNKTHDLAKAKVKLPVTKAAAATPAQTVTFDQVNEVLKAKCATAGCHGTTANNSTVFVDHESAVDALKALIRTRIEATGPSAHMPAAGHAALTDAESATLVAYTRQPNTTDDDEAYRSMQDAPPLPAITLDDATTQARLTRVTAALTALHGRATALCPTGDGFTRCANSNFDFQAYDQLGQNLAAYCMAQPDIKPGRASSPGASSLADSSPPVTPEFKADLQRNLSTSGCEQMLAFVETTLGSTGDQAAAGP